MTYFYTLVKNRVCQKIHDDLFRLSSQITTSMVNTYRLFDHCIIKTATLMKK